MRRRDNSIKNYLKQISKVSLLVFIVIVGMSLVAFFNSIVIHDWMKIGLSLAALVLYLVPYIVEWKFNIIFPVAFDVMYFLFIFASLILGEVFAFYGPFPFWDVVLHFLSGFVLAGIGCALISGLCKCPKLVTMLFALCFSITLGVMWEFVEFSFDMTFRTDAQKDAHVHQISTITLQRDGGNRPVRVDDIVNTDIHLGSGETIRIDEGYLDIGLMDTMKDLLVNVVGAMLFLVVIGLEPNRQHSMTRHLIPVAKSK